MTKVKICGNTNLEDAKMAASLGADFLGFIFAESKRRVTVETAAEIMKSLPDFSNFVGVFLNHPKKEVEEIAKSLGLKVLQFHGDETALYCLHFMDMGYQVIKTFRIKDAFSLKRIDAYNVWAFLLDTYSKDLPGGTGTPFDWNLLDTYPYIHDKLFLAGGLNLNNVSLAVEKIKPYAVDVASGVEKSPGIKDPVLLERFIAAAKKGESGHVSQSTLRS